MKKGRCYSSKEATKGKSPGRFKKEKRIQKKHEKGKKRINITVGKNEIPSTRVKIIHIRAERTETRKKGGWAGGEGTCRYHVLPEA